MLHSPSKQPYSVTSINKYAKAATAIDAEIVKIERVDKLVKMIGTSTGMQSDTVDALVRIVDAKLAANTA